MSLNERMCGRDTSDTGLEIYDQFDERLETIR